MFPALNMELEIVRTVLKNPVNDIYVCTDTQKEYGEPFTPWYPLHDPDCRKNGDRKTEYRAAVLFQPGFHRILHL